MPTFAELSRLPRDEEEIHAAPDRDPPVNLVERVEGKIFPADPLYCVTVFYDPEVVRDDAEFHDLRIRMEQEYGGREINMRRLEKGSLAYERLSPFPESEARFLLNGYVADVEGRTFAQGAVKHSRYAKHNISALCVNAMMMAVFLHKEPIATSHRRLKGRARWQQVGKTMAPIMGKETLHQDERDELVMAQVKTPKNAILDIEPKSYALVEHEGLLLGTRAFDKGRSIHRAYERTPFSASSDGVKDCESDAALFGRHATEIKNQIKFEAKYARYLFRPRLLNTDAVAVDVTALMIATWYSQAIAAMRKVCWLVEAEEASSVAAHALHEEYAIHGFALGTAERLPENANSWDKLVAGHTTELADGLIAVASRKARIDRPNTPVPSHVVTHEISYHHEILAGLMGATYDSHDQPGESPYSNPDIFTASLARWIGRLKRTGTATLDAWTADSILSFWWRLQVRDSLLLSQFPQATWRRLIDIAEAMEADRDMPAVGVTYTWTGDREQPYKCADRNNVLAIEGPLLCFPTLQARRWQEKAALITALGGFEVREKDEAVSTAGRT